MLTSFTLIGSVLTARWSGRLVDRVGPKRVLYWGHLLWALLPGFWVFASPGTALVWLGCGSLWGGTVTTAALTAANKLLTRFPPPAHRPMYVAISSCAGNLAGGLGVLTAGSVLKLLGDWSWSFKGATFAAFHVLFVVSLCLRFASSALLIPRLRDPRREEPPA